MLSSFCAPERLRPSYLPPAISYPLPCQLCLHVSVLNPSHSVRGGGGLLSRRQAPAGHPQASPEQSSPVSAGLSCAHQVSGRLGSFCCSKSLKAYPASLLPPAHLAASALATGPGALSVSLKLPCLVGSLALGHPSGPVSLSPLVGLLAGPQVAAKRWLRPLIPAGVLRVHPGLEGSWATFMM